MLSSPLATPTLQRQRFLSAASTTTSDLSADPETHNDADGHDDEEVVEGSGDVKTTTELERRRRSQARDVELAQLRVLVAKLTERIDKLESATSPTLSS